MYSISESVLAYLLYSDEFLRRVIIHISGDYFETQSERKVFSLTQKHFTKFNVAPTKEEMFIELQDESDISSLLLDECESLINNLYSCPCATFSYDNMYEKAEEWAKNRSMFLALSQSIKIANDDDTKLSKTAIPDLMTKALAVTFDNSVGHDYFSDYRDQYSFYRDEEEKIPFDINILNVATEGGVPRGSLNIVYAGVNVGKSAALCHLAASYLSQGLNVLFVSMEMSEKVTAQRIDANLFNHNINKLAELDEVEYEKKVYAAKDKAKSGRLFIKRYPPLQANVNHIDNLIEEISMKKGTFSPDVIIVDYIGILASKSLSLGKGGVNTNTYFKFVSEELRALAIKHDSICWTAQQFNRSGYSSSDPDLDDAAESFGVTATADFVLSLTSNDELAQLSQYYAKILKTRYSKKQAIPHFMIGIDFDFMRLFDLPDTMATRSMNKKAEPEKTQVNNNKKEANKDVKKIDFG